MISDCVISEGVNNESMLYTSIPISGACLAVPTVARGWPERRSSAGYSSRFDYVTKHFQ